MIALLSAEWVLIRTWYADVSDIRVIRFGQITIVPHGEMFAVTDQAARLKVEV